MRILPTEGPRRYVHFHSAEGPRRTISWAHSKWSDAFAWVSLANLAVVAYEVQRPV